MSGTDNYELPDRHAAQAENERMRKENEELKNELSECSAVIDNIEPSNRAFEKMYSKLTAERDELLGALKGLIRAGQKQGFADSYEREMTRANAALAKHEGEKHE